MTSEGELPLLRQLDRRLGLTKAMAQVLPDPRDPALIEHFRHSLLRQRSYGLCHGYEDLTRADISGPLRALSNSWSVSRPKRNRKLLLSPADIFVFLVCKISRIQVAAFSLKTLAGLVVVGGKRGSRSARGHKIFSTMD